jgi:hypothetical protein
LGVDLNAPDTYQQTKTIVNDWISKLSKYTGK